MKNLFVVLFLTSFSILQIKAQLPEKAEDVSPLLIGETLPDAELKAPDGSVRNLLETISQKPTVILFYRGGWCPYCNTHLAEIQEAESEILSLGYQIIGISPDSPENLQGTDEKQQLSYSLLSDADGELSKAIGIAFQAPERNLVRLAESSDGLNKGFLPVPSVFVTDTEGQILFEYINPNYRTRISSKLLVAVLKNLGTEEL